MRNGPIFLLSGPAWLPLLLACVAFHSKQRKRSILSKQWKLMKSLTNIFKHWSAGTSMSIFEIQLCGKDEYAEHYEHGTEPRLVQQKRSRYSKEWNLLRLQTLHWHWPCMDFVKFELHRSLRPGAGSPVSKSQVTKSALRSPPFDICGT